MARIETAVSNSVIQITTKTPPTRIADGLQTGTTSTLKVNVAAIERELRASVDGEVRFSAGDRGLYASDAGNYRMVPLGVVLPKTIDDLEQTVAVCRRHGAPIVARGGGTGIPGQTVNVAVVLDFSKYMNGIIEMNAAQRFARVQPGIVLDELRNAAAAHGLTFGPDPATHNRNTLGGMIGNNSCGIHSMMAGETVDNIDELDVVTVRRHSAHRRRNERSGTRAHHSHGRTHRRHLSQAEGAARPARGSDSQRVPDDSAPGLRIQSAGAAAGAGISCRKGSRRDRGHMRHRRRGENEARGQPAGALAPGLRIPRHLRRGRPRRRACGISARQAWRRSTTRSSTT